MPQSSKDRRQIDFAAEGFQVLFDEGGIEIRVTDYHVESLHISWKALQGWKNRARRRRPRPRRADRAKMLH